jgi:asparagine synthase (glutamine-hydrolysing)
MCGIVGIATVRQAAEIPALLARMSDTIVHRGPDDSGSHVTPQVGLANRRLSIVDLAGGHQPMHTDDGVSLVFAGEIYNHLALRAELEAKGTVFKTRCDTEVILHLYHALGMAAFARLQGMFAIAIHDARRGEVILARDPVGIKPVYIRLEPGRLLFANEIKSILAALPAKPSVDPQSVWDYLSLRYVPPPRTIWQGIAKLEPGHSLRFSLADGRAEITRFWQSDFTPAPFDPARDYDGEFERLFLEAVKSHIESSDVPVGLFLSGGIDSGAVCAAAIELGHKQFHTISIGGADNDANDELSLAAQVAARFGTVHHQITRARADYFNVLDQVAWHFDEPYGDETGAAAYLLAREARRHVKVAMSGEGSDELLLGYATPNSFAQMAAIENRYGSWPPFLLGAASHLFGGRRGEVLKAIARGGPGAYYKAAASHIATSFADEEKAAFWRGGPATPSRATMSGWYRLPTSVHPLVQQQQSEFESWMVEDLLMKADKMSMAASLEQRVPFLHLPLVEWCQRSPIEARLGDDGNGQVRGKPILRRFVARRLPADILNLPKRGFPVPTIRWFREDLQAQGKFVATSRAIRDWIDYDALQGLVARGVGGERPALAKLWGVAMLDRWFKLYVD